MRHDQRAAALARQLAHQRRDADAMAQIQVRGRLVEQQHAGILRERARQQHELALASRELEHGAVGEILDADPGHRFPRSLEIGPGLEAERAEVGRAAHQHHLARPEGKRDRRLLRHHGEHAGQLAARESVERTPEQRDRAVAGPQHARGDAEQRRLAGAVRAGQRQHFAGVERERHAAQDLARPCRRAHVLEGEDDGRLAHGAKIRC